MAAGGGAGPGRTAAVLCVGAAALVWSTSFAVTKLLLARLGPIEIGTARFCLAAPLLLALVGLRALRSRGPRAAYLRTRPGRRDLLAHAVGGLLGITAYFTVENLGLDRATAGDAALITASYPLTAALLEVLVLRGPVGARRWAGMALAVAGAALITGQGALHGAHRLDGDLLLFSGGLVFAAYNLVTRAAGARTGALTGTCVQTLAGAAGFVVAALVSGSGRGAAMPDGRDWALLGYLALACSVGGFLLYNHGLRRLRPSAAVGLLNLVPLFGVAGAVLLNGERPGPAQLGGGLVVAAGVALGAGAPREPGAAAPLPRPSQSLENLENGALRMSVHDTAPRAAATRPDATVGEPHQPPAHQEPGARPRHPVRAAAGFEKCAIVVAEELPPGLAANGAAVLALSLGRVFGDHVVGEEVEDGDGLAHGGLTRVPLPILRAPAKELREIVLDAHAAPELFVVDFSEVAQAARDYDTYRGLMAGAGTADHAYAGVAVAGPRKAVNRLTGSLPLYR